MNYPITDDMNHCLICGTPTNIHRHHLCCGTSNRAKSTEYKLLVPLCVSHHNLGNNSVHLNSDMAVLSKIIGQLAFEKQMCAIGYSEDEARALFRKEFGKSHI